MKKFIIAALFVFPSVLFLSSCHKAYGDLSNNTNNNSSINSSAISGSWVLTSFTQRTEDKSSAFKGYTFTFTPTNTNSGTVTAEKNNDSVNGSWSYSPAVTYYGSTSKTSITFGFGTSSPFDRLSKIWNVDSTSTSSQLRLSSPEVVEDEHLIFTKN